MIYHNFPRILHDCVGLTTINIFLKCKGRKCMSYIQKSTNCYCWLNKYRAVCQMRAQDQCYMNSETFCTNCGLFGEFDEFSNNKALLRWSCWESCALFKLNTASYQTTVTRPVAATWPHLIFVMFFYTTAILGQSAVVMVLTNMSCRYLTKAVIVLTLDY